MLKYMRHGLVDLEKFILVRRLGEICETLYTNCMYIYVLNIVKGSLEVLTSDYTESCR